MKKLTTLSLALLASTGCGLVKINGLPGSSTTPSRQAAAKPLPAGAAGGKANTPSDAKPDLVKAFLAIRYQDFAGERGQYSSPGAIAQLPLTSVDSHGGKVYGVTPDATWLPGWNPGNYSSQEVPFQVVQAGINRTWQAACFADYAAYRAGWKRLEETYAPKLAVARQPGNFYARSTALRDLYAAINADASKAELDLPAHHPSRFVGLRWDVASALLGVIAEAKQGFALTLILGPMADDLQALVAHGRPWSKDDALERDAFCGAAQEHGTQRIPALPTPRQTGFDFSGVTYPVSDARQRELKLQVNALTQVDRPTFDRQEAVMRTSLPNPIKEPVLTAFNDEEPFIVDSLASKGGKIILRAHKELTGAVGYACHTTSQVDSYTDGGQPLYHTACKTGTKVDRESVEATFDEVPPGLALKKGDAVGFYGDVTARTSSSKVEKGGALQTYRSDLTVHGRYVNAVSPKK